MAERRMFAKTIIDSDAFLDMPMSTQALYFHLSMRADDDGFINNPKRIQRMIGASDDDLKLLIAKSFIIVFESGVVVIKHWRIHNYIRGDRKKDTTYKEEMALLNIKENGAYTLDGLQAVPQIEEAETPRQTAYKESNLPYSFEYKIREYFRGKKCPICGAVMDRTIDECGIISENTIPTIQHNKPISKGGKHELGNISVICRQCNVTIQDEETADLNAQEVIEAWDTITRQPSDNQVTTKRQPSGGIGKDRLGKDRLGKDNTIEADKPPTSAPKKKKYGEYKHVLLSDNEVAKLKEDIGEIMLQSCITYLDEYIEMKGYKAKNHNLCIRKWVINAVNEKAQRNNTKVNQTAQELDDFYNMASSWAEK